MAVPKVKIRLAEEFEDRFYPDSDGKPLGETEYHIAALVYLRVALQYFFRGRPDVYVANDMFLYYQEGDPKLRLAPDVMIVFGVSKHMRRTFKLWREAASPQVIIELASRRTWKRDLEEKPALYAQLGVEEYYIFDPERRYVVPSLRGFRRRGSRLVARACAADGSLTSNRLGLRLVPEGALLRLVDVATGERLLTAEEQVERATAEAERAAAETERAAAAEQRASEAEAELARLRARRRRGRRQGNGDLP
jgi:Uma2 family endonuclease